MLLYPYASFYILFLIHIMTHTQTITPKKRINSIDALRGFALIGIMLLHCMERFDLTLAPVVESPFWQAIDTAVYDSL